MSLERVHVTTLSDTHTSFAFSENAARLLEDGPWGNAYFRTLAALGIEHALDGQTVNLRGEMPTIRERVANHAFGRQMDVIAQESGRVAPHEFQADSYEAMVLLSLNRLSTELPEVLPPTTTFPATSLMLTAHFSHALLAPRGVQFIPQPAEMEQAA